MIRPESLLLREVSSITAYLCERYTDNSLKANYPCFGLSGNKAITGKQAFIPVTTGRQGLAFDFSQSGCSRRNHYRIILMINNIAQRRAVGFI